VCSYIRKKNWNIHGLVSKTIMAKTGMTASSDIIFCFYCLILFLHEKCNLLAYCCASSIPWDNSSLQCRTAPPSAPPPPVPPHCHRPGSHRCRTLATPFRWRRPTADIGPRCANCLPVGRPLRGRRQYKRPLIGMTAALIEVGQGCWWRTS
jgi:hypothetical protein